MDEGTLRGAISVDNENDTDMASFAGENMSEAAAQQRDRAESGDTLTYNGQANGTGAAAAAGGPEKAKSFPREQLQVPDILTDTSRINSIESYDPKLTSNSASLPDLTEKSSSWGITDSSGPSKAASKNIPADVLKNKNLPSQEQEDAVA